jgi:hypothetical protein
MAERLLKPARLAAVLLALVLGFALGYVTRLKKTFPDAYIRSLLFAGGGAKEEPARPAASPAKVEVERERIDALLSLGYAAGYVPARQASGVVVHERAAASPGYNLMLSGHAPGADLVDMEGKVVHSWAASFAEVWPDWSLNAGQARRASFWKRAYLFPNGDLIGMFEPFGLVKLDRRSKVLWAFRGAVHHDLDVLEDGRIFTLLRRAHTIPRIDPEEPTLEDFLVILDSQGRVLEEISLLEALERSSYANLLRMRTAASDALRTRGDLLHTNTVTVLDGRRDSRLAAFKQGNVLLAVRNLDLVAVLDPKQREIVWGLTGMWSRPHEPVLLDSGRLLVFDNDGGGHKQSRVLELDPATQRIEWSYDGPPRFYSSVCGIAQRLPNGNTLITVSTEGRVIEVTPDGGVAWEYLNPHSAAVEGQERVATLFDVVRLPKGRVAGLLSGRD